MRIYLGQTRSLKLIAELAALGFGECVSRKDCLPPRRRPWFLDNGAFSDWLSGRLFNDAAFVSKFISQYVDDDPPDFIVCPDLVASGRASLEFSLRWRERCESLRPGRRYYLVVQDGMTVADVMPILEPNFVGIFVGGTTPWKFRTARAWTRLAHELGVPVHVGRCGTADKAVWCYLHGVDSFDSSQPLWGNGPKQRFYVGLARAMRRLDGSEPQVGMSFDSYLDEEPMR